MVTHHRLAGVTYLPLGTTAHKQGRVAGENAVGGDARFAGSLGTQVVEVFDLVAARTGLRDHKATAAGYRPKAYYPGALPITIRITGDADTGRLLGAQLIGAHGTETTKRVDTYATALFQWMTVEAISDLDLSYTRHSAPRVTPSRASPKPGQGEALTADFDYLRCLDAG